MGFCSASFLAGSCISPFKELVGRFQRNFSKQTWSWEEQLKHRPLFNFLQRQGGNIREGATLNSRLNLGYGLQAIGNC